MKRRYCLKTALTLRAVFFCKKITPETVFRFECYAQMRLFFIF